MKTPRVVLRSMGSVAQHRHSRTTRGPVRGITLVESAAAVFYADDLEIVQLGLDAQLEFQPQAVTDRWPSGSNDNPIVCLAAGWLPLIDERRAALERSEAGDEPGSLIVVAGHARGQIDLRRAFVSRESRRKCSEQFGDEAIEVERTLRLSTGGVRALSYSQASNILAVGAEAGAVLVYGVALLLEDEAGGGANGVSSTLRTEMLARVRLSPARLGRMPQSFGVGERPRRR